jgi:hypothetical protein
MDMLDFYIRVVKALDEIGTPYMIVGAYYSQDTRRLEKMQLGIL